IKLSPGKGIRYIVPNFISGEKEFKAYVRVLEPARDVRLGFEGVDVSFKKPVVKPSEMLELNLKGSRLSALKGKSELVLAVGRKA
ncbi:MAG: pyridine nucleotide-disulfide oxidoreductase, partial [Proteobacteria bacterium]|nr:pyridine nucleotide-disulfide oxidoreductase [Pseudomonadota bacterium]